ncbi:MAG: hypothetical protein J6S16_03720 [Bacteroidales bacterium]|nr:hypothetical protein [Bacteroidales bacterium]
MGMNQANNTSDYSSISSLKELKFQRKLLSSRIEHQEAMIMYKIQVVKENVSPSRLLYMGFESVAARNSVVNVAFKTFNTIRSIITNRG